MTVLLWFVGLILIGLGIASIVKPEEMIYLREHLLFRECEPTEFYIFLERIRGVLSIVAALFIIISTF